MLRIRDVDQHGATTVPRDGLDEAVRAALAGERLVWLDIAAPTPEEEALLGTIGLPELVVEDFVRDRHLPKAEVIDGTLSLTVHGLDVASLDEELRTVELDVAMRGELLVTWHRGDLASVHTVARRLDGRYGLTRAMELLHLLLDTMNDVFVPFMDHLDKRLDVIEGDILDEPTEQTRRDIYALQRDVIQLRRVAVPQAEVIRRLTRERPPGWVPGDEALIRDLHDHLFRMVELSDSYRQLLESAMDSYRSALDDQLNEMLTTLTIISAMLLPVTVLAGLWGTNFVDLPGAADADGFWWLVIASVSVVGLMLGWFLRRGWIGGRAERAGERRRRAVSSALDVLRAPVAGGRAAARVVRRTRPDDHG